MIKSLRELGLITALAKTYRNQMEIESLLIRAELPLEQLPSLGAAGSSAVLWENLVGELVQGRAPGGLSRLVQTAQVDYPGNPVFKGVVQFLAQGAASGKQTLLYLTANPHRRLAIDAEHKAISTAVAANPAIKLVFVADVSILELGQLLAQHQPCLLHIAADGLPSQKGGEQALILSDGKGGSHSLSSARLQGFISAVNGGHNGRLRAVLLNACYSDDMARSLATLAGTAIGYEGPVNDDESIAFARGYYAALANGLDLERAFKLGQAQMHGEDRRGGSAKLHIYTRGNRDAREIVLFARAGAGA